MERKQSGIELKCSTREMRNSHNSVTQRETVLQKTDKSLQRNKMGCKWTDGVTETKSAFEFKRKSPCTPPVFRHEESMQPAHKQRWPRPDSGPQTAGPTYRWHAHLFPYLRKTWCYIWWNPKSDNNSLVGVQRDGPEHHLNFTVNTQRKRGTKSSSYCSETIQSWQHSFSTRMDWADPFLKYYWHASTVIQLPWCHLQTR